MSEKRTAILILGMHRSGTSALTRVLNLCGVDLGSRLMPPAEGNNELGFWEHVEAVNIHERALTQLGRNWSDARRMPSDWLESPAAAAAAESIAALVRDEFAHSPLWAVKDPRACRFVPLWKKALDAVGIEVKLLFVLRHPGEVSASLARRDGMSEAESELLLLNHFFEAAQASAGRVRCAVTYQSLLDDWRGCMQRIARELDIELPALQSGAAQIEQFLDRGARNHHHADDDAALGKSLNGRAYLLARDSSDAAEFWSGVGELSEIWDLYQHDLLPYVDELLDMLAIRDVLERQARAPAIAEWQDQDRTLQPLTRLQFRMISGLQEGMGKLGQASADLGAMVRIGNESALGESSRIAGTVAAMQAGLAELHQQVLDQAGGSAELRAAAHAQQQLLGEVLVQADTLRRHMDDIALRSHAQWGEFARRSDERLVQLGQQADDSALASERIAVQLAGLEQRLAAAAERDKMRWSQRLRRLLSGK